MLECCLIKAIFHVNANTKQLVLFSVANCEWLFHYLNASEASETTYPLVFTLDLFSHFCPQLFPHSIDVLCTKKTFFFFNFCLFPRYS